jgi:hypothetical protein
VRRPLLALLSLAVAFAWLMQVNGWSQNASWAFVRALGDGVPYIDKTVGEIGDLGTGDTAKHGGHLYAAKAPGLPLATMPWYEAVSATGVRTEGEPTRPIWLMNLWGSVLPALLLVVALWWFAEQLEPGLGALTATIVGLGTMVLAFASLFFNHSLATLFGFVPFAILWHERRRAQRLGLVALAGLFVGLGFCVEYQVGFAVGLPLALYALRTREPRWLATRLGAFLGGAFVGALPSFAYNWWAFGSPLHTIYRDYWAARPDAPSTLPYWVNPDLGNAREMLFSAMGLFTLAPVLLLGLVGIALLVRRRLTAEALVVVGVCLIVGIYQSGLGGFGGQGPPRYLMTLVPYLGLPIALTLRAFPLTTFALAAISIFQAVVQAATGPLAAYDGEWLERARERVFMLTAASVANVTGWYTIGVFFLACIAAIVFAALATPRLQVEARESWVVAAGIGVWALIALSAENEHGLPPSTTYVVLAALGAAATAAVAYLAYRPRGGLLPRRTRAAAG